MKRETAKLLTVLLYIVAILLTVLFAILKNSIAFAILVVVSAGLSLYLGYCMRCRHCGTWFRDGMFFAKHCPRCGKKL